MTYNVNAAWKHQKETNEHRVCEIRATPHFVISYVRAHMGVVESHIKLSGILFKVHGWYHLRCLDLKPTQCSYPGAFINYKVIILQRKYDQNYFLPLRSEPYKFNPRLLNEILIRFKESILQVSTSLSMGVSPPPPQPAPGEIHTLNTFQCNTTES